jgi:hypothetical protein
MDITVSQKDIVEAEKVDRSHEECEDCAKLKLEPPICNGHVAGPSSCRQFEERND